MTENNPLLKYMSTILKVMNSTGDLTMVDAPVGFPFEQAYPGQVEAVETISKNNNVLLASATGSGKSAVYLTATHLTPSLIIEPRKFLQTQIAEYRKGQDAIVFGRSEYPCRFEENAADAPCRGKKEAYVINGEAVQTFTVFNERTGREERHPYPCPGCEYLSAVKNAIHTIKSGGTVIANFGNYYPYLDHAKVIIIDEADLFFASISAAKKLRYVDIPAPTTAETIEKEIAVAKKEYENIMKAKAGDREEGRSISRRIDKAKHHYLGLKGMLQYADLCFQYTRYDKKSGKNSIYVEVRPDKISVLKERMFPVEADGIKRKIIIVTATPGNFTADVVISYSVFMRTAIFYTPVALMTASNTGKHPEVFEKCANFIRNTHEAFVRFMPNGTGKKTIVHCGSLAYANTMSQYLGAEKCDVHTSGKLMEIVTKFRTSPAEYLLVTAAEYGLDADYVTHQYILKAPQYATFDERLQCFQSEVGNAAFNEWYELDGMYRNVQQCGRCGRGAGGIGFTFILDQKFGSVYGSRYKDMPPAFIAAVKRGGTI